MRPRRPHREREQKPDFSVAALPEVILDFRHVLPAKVANLVLHSFNKTIGKQSSVELPRARPCFRRFSNGFERDVWLLMPPATTRAVTAQFGILLVA